MRKNVKNNIVIHLGTSVITGGEGEEERREGEMEVH